MLGVLFQTLVACGPGGARSADTGTWAAAEGAELSSLTLSQGTLDPPFQPTQLHYAVAVDALADPWTTITATSWTENATVEIAERTMDGLAQSTGGSPLETALDVAERVEVVVTLDGERSVYTIVSLPDTFPAIDVRTASDAAWDGYLFFGDVPNGNSIDKAASSQLFILDGQGVPVWFREITGPGLDFKVDTHGQLTYSGLVGDGAYGFADFVLDPQYDTVATYEAVGVQTDHREFTVLPDGNVLALGFGMREVDLEEVAPDCCILREGFVQELDPQGALVFEWRTADFFEELWADLPASRKALASGEFDYVHLNSVDIDPGDGNWIVSSRFTSHVLKVARYPTTFRGESYEPGDIVWTLGGIGSDWTFVNDDRASGWKGFAEQHDARMLTPDRITVYDNAFWDDIGATGDSRYVEYALDTDAMTATKVSEHAIEGAGSTGICGSAARLPNGSTVIGWGNLKNSYAAAPDVTEVSETGEVLLELGFPSDLLSYRVGVASWDDETGWVPAR